VIDVTDRLSLPTTDHATWPHTHAISRLWDQAALAAILLLAIFMNFFQLGQNGYGNLYYAAAVKSMGDNWRNFFFVSFDPGGFVTIDKPPLGFWLQTLCTKLFGFSPFSIFFPQAVCGVLAVLLLYSLVRRHFGPVAGLVAALALAVSPITVVTDRNNTIDGTLALALLLAAWAVIHACETGKLRWLLLSSVFVGLGFNIKMAEAYLIVPALGMAYLLCAPRKTWTRIWHLLLAVLVMLAVSLSWLVAVDLTPASLRPYVGSTQDNSELSLAFGYNGLNRLNIGGNRFGRNQPDARSTDGSDTTNASSSSSTRSSSTSTSRAAQQGGLAVIGSADGSGSQQPTQVQDSNNGSAGGFGNAANHAQQTQDAGGAFGSGTPSPFRLFSTSLGGQIAWLLAFALLAIVALAWQGPFNFQHDRQRLGLVLWGCWLLGMATFFTVDASFHQYYMTEMAPGLCALVGIGLVVMWQQYRSAGWRGWLLPIALLVTAGAQIYMLMSYPSWSQWLSPLIGILTALVVATLVLLRLRPRLNLSKSVFRTAGVMISAGLLTLLAAPTAWAGYSVIYNTESSFPTAGPTAQGNLGGLFGSLANAGGGFPRGNGNGANLAGGRNGFGGNAGGFGGPAGDFGGNAGGLAGAFGGGSAQANPALVSYLEAHQGNAKFLVATPSSTMADAIILTTNKPVMAMGGFMGNDPILTTSSLQTLIKNGTVRFFLLNSQRTTQRLMGQLPEQYRNFFAGRGGGGFNVGGGFGGLGGFGGGSRGAGQNALSTWVSSHCSAVPSSAWQSASGNSSASLNGSQLYDCASA
jgi:4-amino-4-deoxy-L-arabinose transferase-like glycosyltransferase